VFPASGVPRDFGTQAEADAVSMFSNDTPLVNLVQFIWVKRLLKPDEGPRPTSYILMLIAPQADRPFVAAAHPIVAF
jgi:hypothetical protein